MEKDLSVLVRRVSLRVTPKRIALLKALALAAAPMTVGALRAKVHGVDLVTIYRNLQSLAAAGLLREVRFKDDVVRYEFAHDGHHHHIVCKKCGAIGELPECDVRSLEKKALDISGRFASIDEHALEFFGTCVSCAKR